jgi:pimeloyl-ACP methyl ester carboxylesterase
MYCVNARQSLFSDMSDAEAETWLAQMQCQPAEGWNDVITYGAWKEIPSIYLIAEEDKLLPAQMQAQFAALAGSEVETVKAGHMLILSQPEKCVEVILKAVGGA